MFKNIEKLINHGYEILIQDNRYGEGYYIAFDDGNRCSKPFAILLEGAYSSDPLAYDYIKALKNIEKKYPDYPFIKADSLEKGLIQINEKAGKWLSSYKDIVRTRIIGEIVVITDELEKQWN